MPKPATGIVAIVIGPGQYRVEGSVHPSAATTTPMMTRVTITNLKKCLLAFAGGVALTASTDVTAATPVSEIVVDAGSGRVLFAAAADRVRPPASLTKMMTLLLTFEAIEAGRLRRDDSVVMSRYGASQQPSKLGLAAGHAIPLRVAMQAVAVISANDVAVSLAERIAGSEPLFVGAMNRRARQLGMTATRFDNASGLSPSGGVTTAADMATLARYIIGRFPERYRLFSARSISWGGQVRPNHNRLLGKVRGVDGVKTGYTVPAGFNLAASSLRDGKRVVVVVLGAKTAAARDLLVANLLESGFSSPATTQKGARDRRKRVGVPGQGRRPAPSTVRKWPAPDTLEDFIRSPGRNGHR